MFYTVVFQLYNISLYNITQLLKVSILVSRITLRTIPLVLIFLYV